MQHSTSHILVVGPCAAETQTQLRRSAEEVSALQLTDTRVIFRAGVWKARTMPGSFEGVGEEALRWLQEIQRDYGLEVATEVATAEQVALALRYGVRCLWVGARTTTSPFLVSEIAAALSTSHTPHSTPLTIMVKNPVSADLALWKGALQRMSAAVEEENVMAVHRGFTGASGVLRNQPKWWVALELRRQMPTIPLLLDPSHIAGDSHLVPQVAQKADELGYDGLMVEMHPEPHKALSDARQQLTPEEMRTLLSQWSAGSRQLVAGSEEQSVLAGYRAQIDELDDELWQLIARRMQLSEQIGAYKREHGIAVLQSDRWQQLVRDRLAWAEKHSMTEENVMQILDAIHSESRRRQ